MFTKLNQLLILLFFSFFCLDCSNKATPAKILKSKYYDIKVSKPLNALRGKWILKFKASNRISKPIEITNEYWVIGDSSITICRSGVVSVYRINEVWVDYTIPHLYFDNHDSVGSDLCCQETFASTMFLTNKELMLKLKTEKVKDNMDCVNATNMNELNGRLYFTKSND